MALTIDNTSGSVQLWGGFKYPVSPAIAVEEADYPRLLIDDDFRAALISGDAIVNNGFFNLDANAAVRALRGNTLTHQIRFRDIGLVNPGSYLLFDGNKSTTGRSNDDSIIRNLYVKVSSATSWRVEILRAGVVLKAENITAANTFFDMEESLLTTQDLEVRVASTSATKPADPIISLVVEA